MLYLAAVSGAEVDISIIWASAIVAAVLIICVTWLLR